MTGIQDPDVRAREDEWLVVRCQLGERPAFGELINRWGDPVRKYVRRLANSDDAVDDIVQDVWIRVLRGIHKLRDGAKLRAWLALVRRSPRRPTAQISLRPFELYRGAPAGRRSMLSWRQEQARGP